MSVEQGRAYRTDLASLIRSAASHQERKGFAASIRLDPEYQEARKTLIGKRRALLENGNAKIRYELPQNPQERFDALFSAIGNSEAKCLTLLCLSQSAISGYYLHKEFIKKSKGVWESNGRQQASHCLQTLIPIGLVAEADIMSDGPYERAVGFRLTQEGYEFGQPIAAYLITRSAGLPCSLSPLFGATNTRFKTRSATNTVQILEALNGAKGVLRETDLEQQLAISKKVIGPHLVRLAQLGLINYSSVDWEDQGAFKYQLLVGARREQVQSIKNRPTLTQAVAASLFKSEVVDSNSLAKILQDQFPKARSLSSFEDKIGCILTDLVKQRICEQAGFINTQRHSLAEITDVGRKVVIEVIQPVKQALSGDRQLLEKWCRLPWQEYAPAALARYKDEAGHANRETIVEQASQVLEIIRQNPGIRPNEIREKIGRLPFDLLSVLLSSHDIRKEKNGKKVCYFPVFHPE